MLPKFEIDPTGAPPAGGGLRRRWVVVVLFLTLPIVVMAIIWGAMRTRTANRLRRAVAEAESIDPGRWRQADLWKARAAVSDDENSATVISYIAREMPIGWLAAPGPGSRNEPSAWRLALLDEMSKRPPTEPLTQEERDRLHADLAALGPPLDEARTLADRPWGRFNVTLSPIAFTTSLSHVESVRQVNRLLTLDAVGRAADHDIDGALSDIRAMVNTGRSIGDEPIAMSQLVRMALVGNALSTLERVLAQGEGSDAELMAVQDLLALEAKAPVLLWAVQGERASSFDTMTKLASGTIGFNRLMGAATGTRANYWLSPPRLLYEHNAGVTLDLMNDAALIARQPMREQLPLWVAWEGRVASERAGTLGPFISSISLLLMPSMRHIANRALDRAAELACAQVILAAERYRLAHGDWPTSLGDLVPDYLDAPPEDPFGPGLILKRDADGLIVYSVGGDGEDDGGQNLRMTRPGSSFAPPSDLGYRLFDPLQRRRPAGRVAPLPDRVFAGEEP
jgi:hypothetical protein